MKKFSIRFPVRIAAFLMMLTILCCSPAYADSNLGVGEISAAEQTLLYTQYEAIAAEVSAESGYAIHVRPLGEMDSFLTASHQLITFRKSGKCLPCRETEFNTSSYSNILVPYCIFDNILVFTHFN